MTESGPWGGDVALIDIAIAFSGLALEKRMITGIEFVAYLFFTQSPRNRRPYDLLTVRHVRLIINTIGISKIY